MTIDAACSRKAPPTPCGGKEPLPATLTAAAVNGRVATGERAGQRVRRRLVDPQQGVRASGVSGGTRGAAPRPSRFRLWHEETITWIVRLKQRSL